MESQVAHQLIKNFELDIRQNILSRIEESG